MPASVPCIFSDQQGRGRTSLGMVIACLIKEMQITTELRSDQRSRLLEFHFYICHLQENGVDRSGIKSHSG